jgi:hypothetical protein
MSEYGHQKPAPSETHFATISLEEKYMFPVKQGVVTDQECHLDITTISIENQGTEKP